MQQNEKQALEFKYSEISRRVNSRILTNVMEGFLFLCSEYMRSKKMPVTNYKSTQRRMPQDVNLPKYRLQNLTHFG